MCTGNVLMTLELFVKIQRQTNEVTFKILIKMSERNTKTSTSLVAVKCIHTLCSSKICCADKSVSSFSQYYGKHKRNKRREFKKSQQQKKTIMQLSRGIQQGEETLRIKKNNLLLVKKPCVSSVKKMS